MENRLFSTVEGRAPSRPQDFCNQLYYLAIDDRNDVNLQRWNGTGWSLFLPELENGSSLTYLSIDFSFQRDSASTNYWPVR